MLLRIALMAIALAASLLSGPQVGQARHCLAYVLQDRPAVPLPAGFSAASTGNSVRITYLGHSTFRLESPAGVVIETDHSGAFTGPSVPDIVTMNRAHSTHYTDHPDPRIGRVLRGWNPRGGPAKHDLRVGDVEIRNVTTDVRSWGLQVERDGNSIFIFEVADLCIGHLGHLHQRLSPEQRALIGRLDIVFAPVDGSYTLDLGSMIAVVRELRASLVIPMHYFGGESLQSFVAGMRSSFALRVADGPTIEISLETLPNRPTVLVLPPY